MGPNSLPPQIVPRNGESNPSSSASLNNATDLCLSDDDDDDGLNTFNQRGHFWPEEGPAN